MQWRPGPGGSRCLEECGRLRDAGKRAAEPQPGCEIVQGVFHQTTGSADPSLFSFVMNIPHWYPSLRFTCVLALSALFPLVGIGQTAAERPRRDEVEARLELAGTNRAAIATALRELPAARRPGMIFLVENMPLADLRSLTADFLLENLNLAYEGWEKSPWHD